VNRIRDEVSSRAELLLIALSGAALAVLLIACTNVASLLLARSLARSRELAVRSALGAGRQRLARQLLTESIGLALAGGIVGILAAGVALPLFGRLVPESVPTAGGLALDGRVLAFGLLVTLLTGIAFGALPAIRVSRAAAMTELRDGGRSGARHRGLRNALVIVELAASVALLITSGLLVRALVQLQATDPGFRAEGVLTLRTWLPWPEYEPTERRAAFYERVLEEVRALPGVTAAAYSSFTPIVMGGGIWPVDVPGDADPGAPARTASLRFVTPDWFETLDIPLIRGRDVRQSDSRDDPFVAVVSESFAERYWPGRDPLGRTFRFAFFDRTVVGVVGDIRNRGLEGPSEPQVYLPYRQVPDGGVQFYAPKDLAVRSGGDPMALVPAIRDIVRRVDPGQPISDVRLLRDIVSGDTAPRRVQLRLLGIFTAIAILLAAIGLHGLLSYTAARRRHEIGVRLALGARRRSILALVARQAAGPVLAGIVMGGLAGYGAGKGLRALLAGVPPADLPTFAVALGLTLVVAIAGSFQPAVRAARTDPARVIRDET